LDAESIFDSFFIYFQNSNGKDPPRFIALAELTHYALKQGNEKFVSSSWIIK